MHRIKHVILVVFILTGCVGCDQATKVLAMHDIPPGQALSFASETVWLQYSENKGAFLSIGSSLSQPIRNLVFIVAVGLVVVVLLAYVLMASSMGVLKTIALSMICAGGLGNLIDRVVYHGHVRDFIILKIGNIHTGIFNLADVSITVGVLLILLFESRKRVRQD